jgi:hypothetical protein
MVAIQSGSITTVWCILRLRLQETASSVDGIFEYSASGISDSRKGGFLQLGCWDCRPTAVHNKPACNGILHEIYDGLERTVTSDCAREMRVAVIDQRQRKQS